MTTPPQLTDQQWSAFRALFPIWVTEDDSNRFSRSRCRLSETEYMRLIHAIYSGLRMWAIRRQLHHHYWTITGWHSKLTRFLSDHPAAFPHPVCQCGGTLWHQTICPVQDTYWRGAIDKGLATQKRQRLITSADTFFTTTHAALTLSNLPS